jgi:hypothetical protein
MPARISTGVSLPRRTDDANDRAAPEPMSLGKAVEFPPLWIIAGLRR